MTGRRVDQHLVIRSAHPVNRLTVTWTNSRPLEIDVRYLNRDMWQALVLLDCSDQTLGLRSVDLTGASGRYAEYPFMFVTALSFEGLINTCWLALGELSWTFLTS
jgi:hypothetical protein